VPERYKSETAATWHAVYRGECEAHRRALDAISELTGKLLDERQAHDVTRRKLAALEGRARA
jgi:hypothetical protein